MSEETSDLVDRAEPKPQKWLDQGRERAYAACLDEVRASLQSGKSAGDILYDLIQYGIESGSSSFRTRFQTHVGREDFSAITLADITSQGATELAGVPISRPVFLVTDRNVYKKFEAVFGLTEGTSDGGAFPGQFFSGLPNWREVNVIVVNNNERSIVHEIRHSIDPYTIGPKRRKGYDRVVGELLAYYPECVLQSGERWDVLRDYLVKGGYFETYSRQAEHPKTDEQWEEIVDRCIAKMQLIKRLAGDVELQRRLAASETLDAFLYA